MFSFVANKSLIASMLVVGVPMGGIIVANYAEGETQDLINKNLSYTAVEDNKYIIYATNPVVVDDFEESSWADNNKYWVQLLGDEQWIECEINLIKIGDKVEKEDSATKITNTLKTKNSVLEIKVNGNIDVNWQTNSIKIKQKSVDTTTSKDKSIKVVTLNFLCAKHKDSWIGKTNYFVGTASATKTYSDSSKFTYCQINKSTCTSHAVSTLKEDAKTVSADGSSVVVENPFGLNLISKVAADQPPTTISMATDKEYLIEFGESDKQNISVNNEISLNDTSAKSLSIFSKLRPVISLGNDKFFDFVALEKETPTSPTTDKEYIVYAVNKTVVSGFVISAADTEDKKYSCALQGSNLWADCSINAFNTTNSQFNDTKDISTSFAETNKVVKIKFNKDIGLNWQSEKIKIQPRFVTAVSTPKEANLTILFSKDGEAQVGKTKYFVGKTSAAQDSVTADGKCTVNKTTYEKCNVYALSTGHDTSDYKFETLTETLTTKVKSTSLTAETHYLISVGSMENQKMDIVRKDINFAFTTDAKKPTFTDIKCISYDEDSKFIASVPAKKFNVEPEVPVALPTEVIAAAPNSPA